MHLILDLDNTLYGYDIPHKLAISNALSVFSGEFDISLPDVNTSFEVARKKTHLELPNKAASHNRLLYFQKLLELNQINSLEFALKYYNLYWDTFLDNMQLFDTVVPFLDKHRSEGSKICVLTDLTAHIQYRKIEKLGLSKFIDFIVTSEEVGIEKPHPYMFERALYKLNCRNNEAVVIGDSWEKDIIGANSMNIKSIWINHKSESRELFNNATEVKSFDQIIL